MKTMREMLTLMESTELNEAGAGPSRIMAHIRNGDVFFMISAMRADLSSKENFKRTQELKRALSNTQVVSFIDTEGEYQEDGQPEPSLEKSFFVMPINQKNTKTFFKSVSTL